MEDLSLHILDIAENSIGAGATVITISIIEDTRSGLLTVEIKDNGKGIPEELIEKVLDPFYTSRTTRKVGLGLPLFAQSAKETGGDISIRSHKDTGTVVRAHFKQGHIDMKPLGNIAETIVILITGNPDIDFFFSYRKNKKHFTFDTRQVKKELEGVPINSPLVLSPIRQYLIESIAVIKK